ncbi:hypothetical protein [Gimesia aquarii]|uniref:Leucine Rich repeats (2 copies) n=1 Tax=Gimesia aquarii TaxID=2527964 RepID=A0A517VTS3_9PLAN|nr:hypothetical protein [Gimesia aquarii]QDT96414.1 hypothetical protein V144x_18690 [Gimesia aquarii]
MKPKMIAIGILFFIIANSMKAEIYSQGADTQKKNEPSEIIHEETVKEKEVVFNFPSSGLIIGLHENREALRILGNGSPIGPPLNQTSRINKNVFEWIASQKQIKKIYLEIVFFNEHDAAVLEQLPHLEEITLVNTNVGDKTIQHLSKMKSLKNVSIKMGNITDRSISIFAHMTNLKYLVLDRNQFFPSDAISSMKKSLPGANIHVY